MPNIPRILSTQSRSALLTVASGVLQRLPRRRGIAKTVKSAKLPTKTTKPKVTAAAQPDSATETAKQGPWMAKVQVQQPNAEGHYFRGDKKMKIVPHAYYTDGLFGHGSIEVGARNRKEYLKQNLRDIRYPVAEWNTWRDVPENGPRFDVNRDGEDFNSKDFDKTSASVFGAIVGTREGDYGTSVDFAKSKTTNDVEQQLYGDLVMATQPLFPWNPAKGNWRKPRAQPLEPRKWGVPEPITEVHSSAYLTADEDELVFGSSISSVSKMKGLETVDNQYAAGLDVELAAEKNTAKSVRGEEKAWPSIAGFTAPDKFNRTRRFGQNMFPSVTNVTETTSSAPAVVSSSSATASKFQIVQLKKEGDLKALPQAPLMNKTRPHYLEDSNKISLSGAVVLQICPEVLLGQPLAPAKFPSVTTIIDVTMPLDSRARLDAWKARKIVELGEEGFKLYQMSLFSDGRGFHAAVESVLKGSAVDVVTVPDRNRGHWESLRNVFKDISDIRSVEERISHPFLCYKGVTDCVISLEGKQSVVEWKTSSTRKDTVQALYDNPVQVAAYLGAINFDENFAERKLQVNSGAVVVAYDSGEPASVVRFDYNLMRSYWALWLKRLQQYWRLASIEKSLPKRVS